MIDSALLENKIQESGLKKTYIADCLGLSRTSFYKKLNNESEFTASQIGKLCKILAITRLTEKETIFFVDEVN